MPTYEYRCPKGHAFEVFQKMSDPPLATCTHCGERAERVVSGGAGFLFKGEGFYITDYRSADYKKKAEAESVASGGKPPKRAGTGSEGGSGGTGSGSDAKAPGSATGSSSGGESGGKSSGKSTGKSEGSKGSGSGSSSGGEG